MQMGTTSDSSHPGPNKKKNSAKTGVKKNHNKKIEELRKKVDEGYYNGTDIIDKIVNKLLRDI